MKYRRMNRLFPKGVLKFISAIAHPESGIMKRIKRTNGLITLVKGRQGKNELFNCDSRY